MGPPGVVKWEEWMSDSDAASRLTSVAPGQGEGQKEWVLKENAMGQLMAKKLPVPLPKDKASESQSTGKDDVHGAMAEPSSGKTSVPKPEGEEA